MLSSFNRHFNETVFRGPENEGGGGNVEDAANIGGGAGDGDGDVSGATVGDEAGGETPPLTVREQLKKSIAEASEPTTAKTAKEKAGDRFGDRQRGEAPPKEGEAAAEAPHAIPAPENLSKEAKAEWEKAPALAAAFVKRQEEMAQGVQELKSRYNLIDQAIAPHTDALRQMNATPADAVNRMFLWFKALAGKPADAFPALAQSMGIDWKQLAGAQAEGQAAPAGMASGAAPEIPEPVKNYVAQLEQQISQLTQFAQSIDSRFGSMEQNVNTQNMAKTTENLNLWAKGKPYFEEVRQDMAKMIETGIVPLKDGQVDLDTAYERAIHFNPEVRAKVYAAQQQADVKVQQQTTDAATIARQAQVGRSRKAGVSLPNNAPGVANGAPVTKKKPGEKTSVRDSLKAAMAELRDQ